MAWQIYLSGYKGRDSSRKKAGRIGGMTSKSVPKNVPMIGTGFLSIKHRRGFVPFH